MQGRERKGKAVVGQRIPALGLSLKLVYQEGHSRRRQWDDGCVSSDRPVSHPDVHWEAPKDCTPCLKLDHQASGRLRWCEEGLLGPSTSHPIL